MEEKHSPPGILDGSLSLEFESRLIFDWFQSSLTASLFTVVDDLFELGSDLKVVSCLSQVQDYNNMVAREAQL